MHTDRTISPGPHGVVSVAIRATKDLEIFVDLCWYGAEFAQSAKEINFLVRTAKAQELGKDHPSLQGTEEKEREKAERLEEFAEVHCKSGFPYLYCLVSLRLWSILETLVKDLVHEMLVGFPEVAVK
jgi:hypothetical protein